MTREGKDSVRVFQYCVWHNAGEKQVFKKKNYLQVWNKSFHHFITYEVTITVENVKLSSLIDVFPEITVLKTESS